MSPKERFISLFDNGVYSTIDYDFPIQDPLNFKDTKKYTDRIKDAQKSTGQKEAILVAEGHLGGMNTIIACQDFKFMGGSMGMAVGNAILEGVKRAVKNKSPFILFAAAGGARMQESVLSLIQMPRTTVAIEMLRDAERCCASLHSCVNKSDNRRSYSVICNAWRYTNSRTECSYLSLIHI